jgi:outer membrane protein assembly factor BamA
MIMVILASSCNPTKYVPQGETLLDENRIIVNRETVKKEEIAPYIKQSPNKRIFGVRFHLGLYNLSNLKKDNWFHNWLRNIGEEPVIFDPFATAKSKEQVTSYLFSKGYFDGKVMETVETAKRKSRVYFNIDLKTPYTIRNIYYEVADTVLSALVTTDQIDCLIEKGKPYDVDLLQAERGRIERRIRDAGYFTFSSEQVYYRVDSMAGNRQVDVWYGVKKLQRIGQNNLPVLVSHDMYRVRKIFVYPDFIPKDVLAGGVDYQKSLDTVEYKGFYFITGLKKPTIKYDVIIESMYVKPGSIFNVSNTERSHSHLMSLKNYRLANISYNEPAAQLNTGFSPDTGIMSQYKPIDCNIQLTPVSRQSFSVELEGTNSGGNFGGALNFIYQNKNLFHGAEQFNLKLKGAYETFSRDSSGVSRTKELGVETSLRLPKFFLPFLESENFIKKYNPVTTIQFALNYQKLPVYTRSIANAGIGYMWNDGPYRTHMVYPLQVNLVKIPFIDPNYYNDVILKSDYLVNSYKDVLIVGGSYSYTFNNQKIAKSRHHLFFRINAEAAGNLLYTVFKVTGAPADSLSGHYNLFGQPFAQFIKTDVDIRYNKIINQVSSIIYRAFVGVGFPYKNSVAMPFERQYYEGGANGIRGWQVRSLGPGSYKQTTTSTYVNQTGDIKIETNVEYRFKLFWILEGAVFVDAGNIWAIKDDPQRPGSLFQFSKFFNDLAIGTGFGMRFDLKFIILRTDIGLKLRDPSFPADMRWITGRSFSNNDLGLVIAIGYPF